MGSRKRILEGNRFQLSHFYMRGDTDIHFDT